MDESDDSDLVGDATNQQEQKSCEDIKKENNPTLQVFVVSKCPFGLQAQRILADIVSNAPSLAPNIEVRYIGSITSDNKLSAMHGDEEAQENLRQICIREEFKDKYWNYISCHIKSGDVNGCLQTSGVSLSGVNSCMADNSRGLEYAKEDVALTESFGVTGSPTLIMVDEEVSEFWFGGRTSEAVKTLLCCGFNDQPEVCSTKLNEASAASSFSETYAGSGDSTSASCE